MYKVSSITQFSIKTVLLWLNMSLCRQFKWIHNEERIYWCRHKQCMNVNVKGKYHHRTSRQNEVVTLNVRWICKNEMSISILCFVLVAPCWFPRVPFSFPVQKAWESVTRLTNIKHIHNFSNNTTSIYSPAFVSYIKVLIKRGNWCHCCVWKGGKIPLYTRFSIKECIIECERFINWTCEYKMEIKWNWKKVKGLKNKGNQRKSKIEEKAIRQIEKEEKQMTREK